MPRLLPALALLVLIPLAGRATAQADTDTAERPGRAIDFMERLQRAVDADDRRAVTRMVRYPATVLASGWNIPVKDSATLLTMYDAVFTPEMRCAIVQSGIVRAQAPAPKYAVVVSPEGLVIGRGAVWASLADAQYKIARMMIPPAVPVPSPRRGPERVTFSAATGERTAQFTGWLIRHNVDTFIVSARRGETIQASIQRFRGHDATLRVSPVPVATGVSPTAQDAGRTWTARAAADTDYRIQVVHLAEYCDPAQQYRLAITVR